MSDCVDMSNCTDGPPPAPHLQLQSRTLDFLPENTDHCCNYLVGSWKEKNMRYFLATVSQIIAAWVPL